MLLSPHKCSEAKLKRTITMLLPPYICSNSVVENGVSVLENLYFLALIWLVITGVTISPKFLGFLV